MSHSEAKAPAAPPGALMDLITGKWASQAVYVAAKLGIADLLKDGPKDCDELARANQVDAGALFRVLRALAGLGVFAEVAERRFALTPIAECLRSDVPGSLRSVAMLSGEDLFWRPWGEILGSVKTGEPAVKLVFGKGIFECLGENPGTAAIFDQAMTNWSAQEASAVVSAYDFSSIGTIVDVGGGHGLLISAILQANPRLRGVLFDAPQVIAGAVAQVAAAGLAGRCQTTGGDFFATVPEGGDAYLLKHIIHDWDDENATRILKHCHRVMRPEGKLLLVESVIPPGNDPFFGKLLDLEMLVVAGGRERTEIEYRDLLAASGFRLTRVVPTRSFASVIEGVRA